MTAKKKTSGYMIDPEARTISPVEFECYPDNLWREVRRMLGINCAYEYYAISKHDLVCVDGDALIRDEMPRYFFIIDGRPYAGKGLVLTKLGMKPPKITLAELRKLVSFQEYTVTARPKPWKFVPFDR